MAHPTAYVDVNVVLYDFVTRIQDILGRHFCGLYLYGSLALGDFDPHHSDIDFLVVTDAELTDDLFRALQDLHTRFDRSLSPWAGKVEAAYIPRNALHHTVPTSAQYPQVEKGTGLFNGPLEIGWSFQRYTLREHGVKVAGPDPQQLFDPVDPHDLLHAAATIAETWLGQVHDPDWLNWAQQRGNHAFVILTLCRFLYILNTGNVASKLSAARWVQQMPGKRWEALIERSLAGQHGNGEASKSDMDNMIALLHYTVEQVVHG